MRFTPTNRALVVLSTMALLMVVFSACGPITEDDLRKWSQNEEGLKRHTELMEDPEVPFHIKEKSVIILVENGWADRIANLIKHYSNPEELSDKVCEPLVDLLRSQEEGMPAKARNALFKILPLMGESSRKKAQEALTKWAFGDLNASMSVNEIWEKVRDKISMPQVYDLAEFPVETAFLMIEKRLETENFKLINWIEYVFEFGNESYKKRALEAMQRYHAELFKQMDAEPENENLFFEPTDIAIVEKFDSSDAVLYLLALAREPHVDKLTQNQALLIAERMFDFEDGDRRVMQPEERKLHMDSLLSLILAKIPEIKDRTGQARLQQAQLALSKTGIPGLDGVPLVVETEKNGKKHASFKKYMGASYYTPTRFVFGVAGDYLEPLVEKERVAARKKWMELHPVQAPAASTEVAPAETAKETKEAEKPAGEAPATAEQAKAEASAEAAKTPTPSAEFDPVVELSPEFQALLAEGIDARVTPLVAGWLTSEIKLTRLFALAGLKYLGTPKSLETLQAAFEQPMSLEEYLGKGGTVGTVARNAAKGIELSRRYDALKLKAIQDKLLNPEEVEGVRQRMLADLALAPEELEKTYEAELQKRIERYEAQKARQLEKLDRYQKHIRWLCLNEISDYPDASKTAELEAYIEKTSRRCAAVAEEKLTRKVLDYFGFDEGFFRSAVVVGITKKEIARRYSIKLRARAYLKVAVRAGRSNRSVELALGRTKTWDTRDAKLRPTIDAFTNVAFQTAKEDAAKDPGKAGVSEAEIKEYEDFIEAPEKYVMGCLMVYRMGLEWFEDEKVVVDGKEETRTMEKDFVEVAAAQRFTKEYFSKKPEMLDFILNNFQDFWYIMQDIVSFGEEQAQKRWALSDEESAHYKALAGDVRALVDQTVAKAVEEKKIDEASVPVLMSHYPLFELALGPVNAQLDVLREARIKEEEARRAAEEAQQKAEEAAAGKQPKAEEPKAEEPKAEEPKAEEPKA